MPAFYRWCTTASGYMRIFLFDVYELNHKQMTSLKSIIGFIVNIYVPVFVKTNLAPTVPDAPSIILLTRDLMKDFGVPDSVKQCFLEHAQHWMSPVNAAVCVHQEAPAILKEDLKKIRVLSVNTRELCWSNKPVKSFLTVESVRAPCITRGSSPYWRSLENHNRSTERYIDKMSNVIKHQRVKDQKKASNKVDCRIRGYVLNMEN